MTPRARAREQGRPRAVVLPRVAVLSKRGRFLVAEPVFEGGRRIALEGKARAGAGVGDLVQLGGGKRGVRVLRRVGRLDVARDVVEALMLDRGLRRAFPSAVEAEAGAAAGAPGVGSSVPGGGSAERRGDRRDLRDMASFTIDPIAAQDFDDAISARIEDGVARVWVHIADVSAYVRPGTALERETARRATSVYVPGAVEPMLPEALSNVTCSLVPGEDRLTVTVEMELAGDAVRSASFYRSLIRSDARLTYEQVDDVWAGRIPAEEPWAAPLAVARKAAAALADERSRRGALEVESMLEPSFDFDADGHVIGVHHEEQTESHRLIEQLMILANEQVAGLLADRRIPTLYRVHERPDPQRIEFLVAQLASLGVPTPALPEHMTQQQAADAVGRVSAMVAAHVRRSGGGGGGALVSLVLRSLKQASYSPKNLGHSGLQSSRYCHFTSPIRRYPDLVAHRALLAALGMDDVAPRADGLDEAAAEASAREREAMEIERSADDVCTAFLLERAAAERDPDAPFEGEVVGLIPAGAFIRFGSEGYEGFLPVRRMRDYWTLNEEGTILSAERSGSTIRLGDPISVLLGRIDPPRGRVDLLPAG